MRIAALYDIHGNLPALQAVLAEVIEVGVDQIVVGGDVIPGPMSTECLELLATLELPVQYIRGNGESGVLEARGGKAPENLPEPIREVLRWVADTLTDDQAVLVAGWPLTAEIEASGLGPVLFCHATPRDDNEIFTRITPEERVAAAFADAGERRVIVCGHTHMQFEREVGGRRIVNAGSVGMPFEDPGAYWLLLGPEVERRRTSYDLDEAARRIRKTAYPQREEFAAQNVLDPPRREAMEERLEAAALK